MSGSLRRSARSFGKTSLSLLSLLRQKPGFLGGIGPALPFQQCHDRAGFQIVQPHQHLPGFDVVAVAHGDFRDHAAVEVLHGLAVGVRRHDTGRHGGACQGRQRRPGGKPAKSAQRQQHTQQDGPAHRRVFGKGCSILSG